MLHDDKTVTEDAADTVMCRARSALRGLMGSVPPILQPEAAAALEALDTVIDGVFVGTKRVKIVDLVRFATSVEALLAAPVNHSRVFDVLLTLVYDEEGLGLHPTAGAPR